MKYFKTFEGFKKEYMKRIDLKDFKKIKKGSKLTYMGGPAEVMDNNGYVLTLKGEDGRTFTVNKSQFDHGGFINELRSTPVSGTMSGSTQSLEDRKYELKKDVKGAQIGNFTNVLLPKGTIIYNLPGGVFADHFSLKNKYSSRSSQGPQYFDKPTFKGISVRQMPNILAAIEKNSKVLESLFEGNLMKDLEKIGGQIDYLSDADSETKKIWKKAGVNPNDDNLVILYSYVNSWPETKRLLNKSKIDYKELEDPNSAGESFIVFSESLNEADDFKPHMMYDPETGKEYKAEKPEDHERMAKLGYVHEKPKSVDEAANVPSNIEKFAKERGVLRDVKQIARWAEKAGLGIRGGTAIGKGYDTLVLDLTYQGAEIYFDTYKGTIKVNRQPVNSWKTFSKAVSGMKESVNEDNDTIQKDIMDHWFELYGEKFINKYPAVAKILKQRKNIDARELSRIWDETYGEDFKEKYPAMWDKISK